MELEKFLMNDKNIASCLPRIKTKVTNNKNKLWKLKAEKPQLQSVSIFFQLNAPFYVSCVIYVTGQNHTQVWVFEPRLILDFLSLTALIHELLGLADKGKWEPSEPRLQNFTLNLILNCNIFLTDSVWWQFRLFEFLQISWPLLSAAYCKQYYSISLWYQELRKVMSPEDTGLDHLKTI